MRNHSEYSGKIIRSDNDGFDGLMSQEFSEIFAQMCSEAGVGAVYGGVGGVVSKYVYSFFSPEMVSNAGNFLSFAGVGALAALLKWVPQLLTKDYLNNNDYLAEHTILKSFIENSLKLAYSFAAVAASAALIGCPVGPTVACMMLLPTITWVLTCLNDGLSACISAHLESKLLKVA
ncbi:hypothetical protein [Legionella rowbothamii]|uniref:hypothetical protein n=1 Tax=Legionella rowbothamii TaxID=96229 RepID=UPI0010552009|nr:hypothetical protein [Legionella rowbothamii]